MSGLKWVRLWTSITHNQKIVDLAGDNHHRAGFVYCMGLAYSGGQGTDGWIPRSALPLIHGRKQDADHLVAVGLWIPRPGGWDIHDWECHQETTEETAARSARMRNLAQLRWSKPPPDNVHSIDSRNA